MHLSACLVTLISAPLLAVAIPTSNLVADEQTGLLLARQRQPAPPPCVRMDPPPTQEETDARFNAFVEAFVGKSKKLAKAFEYIAEDYIVRLPGAFCVDKSDSLTIEPQPRGTKWVTVRVEYSEPFLGSVLSYLHPLYDQGEYDLGQL